MQDKDGAKALEMYGNMLYRLCFVMLRNNADAQDAVQDTLFKYLTKAPDFENAEHEKAWLITVASNQCRNIQRQRMRVVPMDPGEIHAQLPDREDNCILKALMLVPEKYRIVLTLHYVEGYKVKEIAHITGKSSSAVKMRLAKGRRLLEDIYRKEFCIWT